MRQNTFFNSEQKENALNRINIINFIDVALVLVIILLMVSPMIEQGLEVRLPVSSYSKMAVEKSVVLTIAKGGKILWGNREIDIKNLESVAKNALNQNPELGIVIKGERTITYQDLIDVLDILKSSGIKKIGLATQARIEK